MFVVDEDKPYSDEYKKKLEDRKKLTALLETYLKSKKTWWGSFWGRVPPEELFNEDYFELKIEKLFGEEELQNRARKLEYIKNLLTDENNKKSVRYYFDKGNIFKNVSYALRNFL